VERAGLGGCLWVYDAVFDFNKDSCVAEIDSIVVVSDYGLLNVEEREGDDLAVQFLSIAFDSVGIAWCVIFELNVVREVDLE
jgi:hypothetical protein